MVRKKCEWYAGSMHHITTRGNRRSDLFKDEVLNLQLFALDLTP